MRKYPSGFFFLLARLCFLLLVLVLFETPVFTPSPSSGQRRISFPSLISPRESGSLALSPPPFPLQEEPIRIVSTSFFSPPPRVKTSFGKFFSTGGSLSATTFHQVSYVYIPQSRHAARGPLYAALDSPCRLFSFFASRATNLAFCPFLARVPSLCSVCLSPDIFFAFSPSGLVPSAKRCTPHGRSSFSPRSVILLPSSLFDGDLRQDSRISTLP